ncbi:MAG TPA: hypothetical protein VK874_05300 [Gaiellaceae bacterium]|jgi:hypothetical protein|nr:hypothetical protein [Gaiellaceae bacterium]
MAVDLARVTAPPDRRAAEEELVVSWRFEVLFRAGYTRNQAFLLARQGADLHQAVRLLQRGCPVETALEILL